MSFAPLTSPRGNVWSPILVLVPLLLMCTPAAADDLASEVKTVLKAELEQEFGPLNDQIMHDETQIYGRVIAIDFALPEGGRLDDTWDEKVVTALGRLGISAESYGDEVRADQQTIAGREAASMQFTTSRPVDPPDSIGFTAMFPPGS